MSPGRRNRTLPSMKLAYTILYVDDVAATLTAWEAAFGLERRFLHESGTYAELETGSTTLSFAGRDFGREHFTDPATRATFDGPPARFEIGLITHDVAAAFARAVHSGMVAVVEPALKPWGQTVGWVKDGNGILVEVASPMGDG